MFMQMAARRRRMGGFSPFGLFKSSEPGVWLDPSDLSTLFQDDAGTTPVTAAGQSVGLVLDKSGRGNHAKQATAAKRPIYQVDSDGRGYLSFDGTDDALITPKITPGTDKVQVFAGVRKLSDSTTQVLYELSANINNNNGSFLAAPGYSGTGSTTGPYWNVASKGTAAIGATSAPDFPAPQTAVQTHLSDIGGDMLTLRINGAQVAQSTSDQGTGNFLAYPLYIGMRGGSSQPFNGRLYGLITRFGPNLAADQISQAERWMNTRTGAF
ncbi:MAG: hypothetical protein ACLGIP_18440 [Alphaproteobacteria bacterium]